MLKSASRITETYNKRIISGSFAVLVLGLLGTVTACTVGDRPAPAETFSAGFRREADALYLPLCLPCLDKSSRLYKEPMMAIQIESIEVDGHKIDGKEKTIDFDEFPSATFEPTATTHVYQLCLTKSAWNDKDFELVAMDKETPADVIWSVFGIPSNAKKIILKYKPRYCRRDKDYLGETITLVATDN